MKRILSILAICMVLTVPAFAQYQGYPEAQMAPNTGTDTGAVNAIIFSAPGCTSTLVVGLFYKVIPGHANTTTTPTVTYCGGSAKTITKFGTLAVVANDLTTSAGAVFYYDGTFMELQNPQTVQNAATSATAPVTDTAGVIACPTCTTSAASLGNLYTIVGAGSQAEQALSGAVWNSSGYMTTYDGMTLAGIGLTAILGVSDKTAQSASLTTQNLLASTPAAGHYEAHFYLDQNALCTTGQGSVYATVTFTDATTAHTALTIPLILANGSISSTTGFVDATISFYAANASAVTYTTTYAACTSGTGTYDLHASIDRKS